MSSNLRIEIATPEDIPELAALTVRTFAPTPFAHLVGYYDTPESIAAASKQHLRSWHEHMDETGEPSALKCVYTNPDTGEDEIVACAQWFIYSTPRSAENLTKWNYHLTLDWMPEDEREKGLEIMRPMVETRVRWMKGRGIALLQYMATRGDFRRKGAASLVVKWGMERCRELGIPAYLEASKEGRLVYEKLGFKVVEEIKEGRETAAPVMIWWPPSIDDADRRPL